MRKYIKDLFSLLTIKDRMYLLILLFLSVIVSVVELFSLSLVVPFLALVNNQDLITQNKYINFFYSYFAFSSTLKFLFFFGVVLVFIIIFRGIVNLAYFYFLTKFSKTRYRTLAFRLFKKYLNLNYIDYIKDSSSRLIHNILNETLNFTNFLFSFLLIVTEIIVIVIIYTVLMIINWRITFSLTVIIGIVSLFVIQIAKPIMSNAGKKRATCQSELISTLNETFGNYNFIKFLNNKNYFQNKFFHSGSGFIRAEAIYALFSVIPKIFMETLGICILLIVLLYSLFLYKDTTVVVTLLTMYAIAFFRLLPSVNRIMVNWGYLTFFKDTLFTLNKEFQRSTEDLKDEPIKFLKEIKIHNLTFEYEEGNVVLDKINLTISKGSKVAIFGKSGCGKSTLIDLLSGLLKPKQGEIRIDDVLLSDSNILKWRETIGYIPQEIYLFNGTVAENVVCGRDFDKLKLEKALKKAKIYDFLHTKDGINTFVGENGVMLSGGQKQRIAIARALYDDPNILILDEATSALDKDTEEEIMKEILEIGKNITIIMVTHREYFLDKCDLVYRFNQC